MTSIFRFSATASLWAVCSLSAMGQWSGWPVPTNGSWYALESERYVSQIHSAIVERCEVTGVAKPVFSHTWSVFGGYAAPSPATNPVTLQVFSNPVTSVKTVAVTNLGPFSYSYTNWDGTVGIATAYPPVLQSDIAALDTTIGLLIPRFLVADEMQDDTYSAWLRKTNSAGVTPDDFPAETKGGLFSRLGIGYVPSVGTNGWGVSTGAVAYFTRWPAQTTNDWTLASTTYKSNGWAYTRMNDLDLRLYDAAPKPVLRYTPAGSGAWANVTFTLGGTALRIADQVTTSASETITMSSGADHPLDTRWKTVTSITASGIPANTGDSVVVTYLAPFSLYGDQTFRLFAADLNERQRVLNALICTKTNLYVDQTENWWGMGSSHGSAAAARAAAESDFQSRAIDAQASASLPSLLARHSIGSGMSFARYVYGDRYSAIILAGKWRVRAWPTNGLSATRQTYHIAEYVLFSTNRVDKSYVELWDNQPVDTNIVIKVRSRNDGVITVQSAFLADVQSSSSYSPIEYGTVTMPPDWCSEPGPGVFSAGKGMDFGFDYDVGYGPQDRPAAWGVSVWDFRYK